MMTTSNGKAPINRVAGHAQRAELARVERPTRNSRVLWVEKLKGNDVQKFVCVSPKMYGFCTHYTDKGTKPCFEDHDFCEGGHSDENLRENFVVMALSLRKNKMVFLYLTPGAAQQLEDQIQPGESLRGLPLVVERTSANNGRLNVRIGEFTSPVKLSIAEIDPWESIMVFLKVDKRIRDKRRGLASPSRQLYPPG